MDEPMTLTAPDLPGTSAARPSSRPVWRTYGGGGLLLGGAVLLFATVVEWIAYAGGAGDIGALLTYGIAFVAALAVLAVSTLPLALGSTGRDGVVGASVLGRIALVAYGWLFLAAQIALLFATFAEGGDVASTASLAITVAQTVAAIVAVVVIVRARIATGVARWSFAVSVAVGIVAGALANATPALDAVMVGFCLSAISIALVGLTYLVGRDASTEARA
jgi:hypothetical protein